MSKSWAAKPLTACMKMPSVKTLSFSYWNVAGAVVVFDKYARKLGLDAKRVIRDMLREPITLSRLHRLMVVSVSPPVLRTPIKPVLKYHIYIANALSEYLQLKKSIAPQWS